MTKEHATAFLCSRSDKNAASLQPHEPVGISMNAHISLCRWLGDEGAAIIIRQLVRYRILSLITINLSVNFRRQRSSFQLDCRDWSDNTRPLSLFLHPVQHRTAPLGKLRVVNTDIITHIGETAFHFVKLPAIIANLHFFSSCCSTPQLYICRLKTQT